MNISDLTRTITPKSDQLNADDLIAGPINVTVQAVRMVANDDQPIVLEIGQGRQPYKPCKSMRRLLIFVWGKDGNAWVGRSMTLFNDPNVTWAGQKVGGIRISHVSHIDEPISLSLTANRGKRKPYTVEPLVLPAYNQSDLEKNLGTWGDLIQQGKTTPEKIIAKIQQAATLTVEQQQLITNLGSEQSSDDLPDL